jgi:Fe-S cluster assembly protein SufD
MSALPRPHAAPAPTAALRSFEAQWLARAADPLRAWREPALRRFLDLGLPTPRDESWRYTNLRRLAAQSFATAAEPRAADRIDAPLAIVNGYAQPPTGAAIPGLEISTLRELVARDAATVARHLGELSGGEEQRWALLNTALFVDGYFLKVTGQLAAPIVIVHATPDGAGSATYPRVIIEAAEHARATIIERHATVESAAALSNSVTQIDLARGAQIEHYRLFLAQPAATTIHGLTVRQQAHSRCQQYTIVLGGGLVRTSLEALLEGAGAELESFALLVGHAGRHVDCLNVAAHRAPHTRSRQTARAIASGPSRVVFNSRVLVDAGAAHAESMQSSRGLLLSAEAEIDSRPQLEIHTDEVKCAHGATTGRLDPGMLFYLLSRGIDRDTAQSLLVYAFLADVLTGMSSAETRAQIETALIAQLPDPQLLREFR